MKNLTRFLTLACTSFGMTAHCLAFGIDKLSAELDAGRGFKSVATFTVFNDARENAIYTTAKMMEWEMDKDGNAQLTPTKDVQILPSVQKIAGGESAAFKVRYVGAPPQSEKSYRVVFEEIQLPVGAQTVENDITEIGGPVASGVAAGLAMTVPVYVSDFSTKADVLERVTAKLKESDGKVMLEVDNPGNRHVLIPGYRLNGNDGKGLGAVLAGHQRLFPFEPGSAVRELSLTLKYGNATKTVTVAGAK